MSSRPDIPIHDKRLDDCANHALNRAAELRAAFHTPPELINPKILLLSLMELPRIRLLADQSRVDRTFLQQWAFNETPLCGFSFQEPYQNPNWQSNYWDIQVDQAIESAYRTGKQMGLERAPSGTLVGTLIRSDALEDLLFFRDRERMAYEQLADKSIILPTKHNSSFKNAS